PKRLDADQPPGRGVPTSGRRDSRHAHLSPRLSPAQPGKEEGGVGGHENRPGVPRAEPTGGSPRGMIEGATAEVALPLALDKVLSYRIPGPFLPRTVPGVRVLVPLGRSTSVGVVVGALRETPGGLKW